MSVRRHLVLFAKAPLIGQAKRRLGADIGPAAAAMFHYHMAGRLIHRLGDCPGWRTWLAVSPDNFVPDARRVWPAIPRGVTVVPQGTGDIGIRMDRALRLPESGPVILVGTDIAGMAPQHIERAFSRLGAADAVLGPATDGGFWLIGFGNPRTAPSLFEGVRWSTPDTYAGTAANAHRLGLRLALADTLADVDDGAAYRAALSRWW